MPPKTPLATKSTAGYVVPELGIYGGVNPVATALTSVGQSHPNRSGLKMTTWYFTDIDDTDTWTSGIPGIVAVAWQANQADTDKVGASLTTAATGVVTFDAENANSAGWLWVLSRN
jgi:hypothetical protein